MKKLAKRVKKLLKTSKELGTDTSISIHPDSHVDRAAFVNLLAKELGEKPVVQSAENAKWAYFLNQKLCVFL